MNNIKQLRKHLNLTQTEFGNIIGRGQAAIQQYESGKRQIDDTTILLICKTFNVSEKWLREGIGAMFIENSPIPFQHKTHMLILDSFPDLTDEEMSKVAAFIAGLRANR